MKVFVANFLWLLALIIHSEQQCLTTNDQRIPNPNGQQGLYHGQQSFSLSLLQAINQLTPNENVFFSPYSTYHALLLTYFISANQTEKYLKKSLSLDPKQDKADVFNAYKLDRLATQIRAKNGTYEFTNANRIYVTDRVTIRDCIVPIFGDELQKTDFRANPEATRQSINGWVESQTHDMIRDLIPPGSIDKMTNLVLVNAAYFKGKWENKFNPEETKPEVFYVSPSKQTIVDMMHVEATFNYDVSETLMAHVLELPYEGEDISMYILLPPFSKEDGIETVLKRLTLENFNSVVNGSLLPRQVQVSLPKFGLEHTIELVPVLEFLGVGDLFKAQADFSILTGSRDLAVGEGLHKAKIEIDEEGAKAAAATALFTWRMMQDESDQPAIFKCNRPFIFTIFNKKLHTILFSGIFRRPQNVLEKIGVGDLFQRASNLSVLTDSDELKLGGALHKAKIEVTEEGTKAAAATVLFTFRSSRPLEPAQFKCNHPFIYLIFDKVEQSVLFTGVFRRPY